MKKLALLTSIVAIFSACEDSDKKSSDTDTNTNVSYSTAKVNASDYKNSVYFSFASNSEVGASEEWDLELKRTSITGSPASKIALANTPDGYYDADDKPVLSSFESADTEQESMALSSAYDLSTLTFINDELVYAIDDSWFNYNFMTHEITANSDSWFIVSDDNYENLAKLRAASYDATTKTFTFEAYTQLDGDAAFDTTATTFTVAYGAGDVCFDIETEATVDCATDAHLIHAIVGQSSIDIALNGKSYRTELDTAGANAIASTTDITDEPENMRHYFKSDAVEGTIANDQWYAYSLLGNHKLWPNFRTYIIDTDSSDADSAKYAFQVVDYYNEAGTSGGYITINFEEIQ